MKIFIVEDSSITRLIERKVIESLNLRGTIYEAEDGTDALRLMREVGGCDLMVLDIDMPRQNGLEVLQDLQAKPLPGPSPKVIIVSAMGDGEIVRQAMALGVKSFVLKPFTKDQLGSKIRALLNP